MRLEESKIDGLRTKKNREREKYRDTLVEGLVLTVSRSTRIFVLVKTFRKKRVYHRIGYYPDVSLKKAREEARRLIKFHERQADKRAELAMLLPDRLSITDSIVERLRALSFRWRSR